MKENEWIGIKSHELTWNDELEKKLINENKMGYIIK